MFCCWSNSIKKIFSDWRYLEPKVEPVSEAIEMEKIAQLYGAGIIVSKKTYDIIKNAYHIREVDIVSQISSSTPLTINEVVARSGLDPHHDLMSVKLI